MVASYFTHGVSLADRNLFTSTVKTQYGTKRYFSSIESEIYFGDKLMEDILDFSFSLEEAFMPIYGFNSFVANAQIRGRKVIQGTFAINFTEAGYVNKVLKGIKESSYKTDFDMIAVICNEQSAPQFNKIFDIMLGYGYYNVNGKETYNSTYQELKGVQITGVQQALDISGNPIMEVYQFVAKDLVHKNRDYTTTSASQETEEKAVTQPGDK